MKSGFYILNHYLIQIHYSQLQERSHHSFFKDRVYATEEIQQLLVKADERTRVVVLLLASTGMRIGAIPGLKLEHLTNYARAKR